MTSSKMANGAAPITIFALPKALQGHFAVIQRNAILSWRQLEPRPEILLFGDDAGTSEIAQEFGLRHLPRIERNEFGTPLMNDLFGQARRAATHDTLCYVNSDIILFSDFTAAVARANTWQERYLMVGRRLDYDLATSIAFDNGWESSLRATALGRGKMNVARSIDYFVFPRNLFPPLPAMAIGRFWWDNWLIWKARSLNAPVLDATAVVLAVHQNHDYSHSHTSTKDEMLAGEESMRNCRLGCEAKPKDFEAGLFWRYYYTIDDASHVLTQSGIRLTRRHAWKTVKRALANSRTLPRLAMQSFRDQNQGSR